MKLNKKHIYQITQLESFQSFFSNALDKKLQYSELNELADFVFGGLDNAVKKFVKEEKLKVLFKQATSLNKQ